MAPYSISHSTLCNTHLFNSNIPPIWFAYCFFFCSAARSLCLSLRLLPLFAIHSPGHSLQSNPKIQTKANRIEFRLAVSEKCEWTMLKKRIRHWGEREREREILPEIDEEHDKRVFRRIRDYELNLQQKVIRFKKHIHEWYEWNQQPRVVFHVHLHRSSDRHAQKAAIQFFIVLSPETEMKTNKCAPNS